MKNIIISLGSLLTFIFITAVTSCHEDSLNPDHKQINFQSLQVGQQNKYIRYFGFCDYFQPTHDTLILAVTGFDGHALKMKESFTPASPLSTDQPDPVTYTTLWNKNFIVTTQAVRSVSHLFFYFASDTLWLNKTASLNLIQDQCRVYNGSEPFEGSDIGNISTFDVGDEQFLLKKIITQIPSVDSFTIWDTYLVFDQNNIYSSYRNVKENIYVLSPTVSAFALINN